MKFKWEHETRKPRRDPIEWPSRSGTCYVKQGRPKRKQWVGCYKYYGPIRSYRDRDFVSVMAKTLTTDVGERYSERYFWAKDHGSTSATIRAACRWVEVTAAAEGRSE